MTQSTFEAAHVTAAVSVGANALAVDVVVGKFA
jgi:hypothetical protein